MRLLGAIAVLAACSHHNPATPKDAPVVGVDAPIVQDALLDAPAVPQVLCTGVTPGSDISVQLIGQVGDCVTLVTTPPGDDRLFIVEQGGRIQLMNSSLELQTTPFLDLTATIVAGGELGLLGLAFDPDYANNRQFYVYYTTPNPASASDGDPYLDIVARYTTMANDPDIADPASGQIILSVLDFASNHNGGMMEFGSDGLLYISTGDGGDEGDPHRSGQNPFVLFSKMLRIDVDHPPVGSAYGIPTDNPFADGGSGAPEVFMMGLRNPWRWSFDRATGDIWIGDVGQDQFEEVDYLPAGQQVGQNMGWSVWEGSSCCAEETGTCEEAAPLQGCSATGFMFPQIIRSHAGDSWSAVIGGQVYRGSCYSDIVGTYFFTDYGFHGMSEAVINSDGTVTATDLPGTWPATPASLHAGPGGELFETTTTGAIYHITAGSSATSTGP